ncbi:MULTISPECIES: LLM class flavin-dependent oxidoreductase [Methylosinus]|uniref:LLM class flavin-dependent oxidoreductase n=1 Tax=Methylosinus trichosporium (strain ATCC 35070 / NCIMB 11131 / UNIQEM 75 / OB3b) TaxID=595536 RepID=A0A2D2D2X9_METT3|nr:MULTISPECIES: LLM class flavin-dependent oxidoreductase [Methylosinus]ATQ69347.1 LLM class flavin-dependent oxidoreductase [Methylosinus trichosporium OB3b]OBS52864.1 luciferase [Methylosinus sp. 3S-1]
MRFGVFCTYENPQQDFARCFETQTRLVRHAEALGFEEAWVAEHHFDADAVCPSILSLLAYLSGVTSRIRLGSAAVLLAFRNPIQVAEDVATIDNLSHGRFEFGVARGGPFEMQNRHFGAGKDHTREMTLEALGLVERLLYEDKVTFTGAHYQANGVSLSPRPVQKPIPTYLATTTPGAIRYAARNGYGVMAGPPFPIEQIAETLRVYREAAGPEGDPRFTMARFYFAAPRREQALAEAVPFLARFAERMRGNFARQDGAPPPSLTEEGLLERSLIGDFDEVAEKIAAYRDQTAFRAILLKPISRDAEKNLRSLEDFARHIRPALGAEPAAEAAQ